MPSLSSIGRLLVAITIHPALLLVHSQEDIAEVQQPPQPMVMGLPSEPFSLNTLEQTIMVLPVSANNNNNVVRCTMTADAGSDPDLIVQERRSNGSFGNYLCYDSRAGPFGECPDMTAQQEVTDFWVTITAYGPVPSTNTVVLCESYRSSLTLGEVLDAPSSLLLSGDDDIVWFLLDTTKQAIRMESEIQCRIQSENGETTPNMVIYSETQQQQSGEDEKENLCQESQSSSTSGITDCEFQVQTSIYWIGVVSTDSFSVLCEPVVDPATVISEDVMTTTTSAPTQDLLATTTTTSAPTDGILTTMTSVPTETEAASLPPAVVETVTSAAPTEDTILLATSAPTNNDDIATTTPTSVPAETASEPPVVADILATSAPTNNVVATTTSVPTESTASEPPVVVENTVDTLTTSHANSNNNNTQVFALNAGESLTFVTQAKPGEAVFCWIGETMDAAASSSRQSQNTNNNHTAAVHRHSEVELILGVNELPNPKNPNVKDHDCHSDNFFKDDDVCFVYGGSGNESSTIYATVQSTALAGSDPMDMALTCESAIEVSIGTLESASFDVAAQGLKPFLVNVPSTVDRIVCSTRAKEGDIDMYVKVGEEGLAEWDFDCTSTSDVAVEECDLTISTNTAASSSSSSTPVFIILYAYRPTTEAVISCAAVDSTSVVVNRGENPDLP